MLEITIKGNGSLRWAPSWVALQTLLTTSLESHDEEDARSDPGGAMVVRIRRDDNGCDYRAPGVYSLTLANGLDVKLTVEK